MTSDRRVAEERIRRLFELASDAGDLERATEYVERAREIAERNRVRLPAEFDTRYCGDCGSYLRPGDNARVRLRSERGHVVVRCGECGATLRHPYEGRG